MVDNRMRFTIDQNMQFPLVEIDLGHGGSVYLQQGSMVYHTENVTLNTKLNGKGSGLGKLVGAIGRSMVSGESMFITQAMSNGDGKLALAPNTPGQIIALELGEKQYRLNDGAFLALDGSAQYKMERQNIGKALFGGQGGLFVMTTEGLGTLLANSFGSIKKITLDGGTMTIDNAHVVAWSRELDYDIHLENGFMQSIGTGEGVVNTFRGHGEIYIQSLNLEQCAGTLKRYLPTSSN
ncbi:TPA: TIGR00266 family protein [Streptococcus pyogenes]|uniref:TIGR00266 family protein n=1 Tax=Streptococcus pyogenes TaxID=1314 RepID=UPI0002F05790|nr:TIGR00266 family protein [Streptococcus pyogenes]HER4561971.1 TIGR00266 family protein [Streptococcus pyogenes NGAS671]HER4770605.1 TIGR00266 family protein [Streptococcus pyogenes NGAS226]HEP2182444.1 TIGR00266 family protein [Streptococcus pyogenes]HEP2414872.1 TIGR00266 family protein [Streptococcus pyogenes]HEQ0246389.1 TIGR00266 family protein [Streptococcus pyogenes]